MIRSTSWMITRLPSWSGSVSSTGEVSTDCGERMPGPRPIAPQVTERHASPTSIHATAFARSSGSTRTQASPMR